MDIAREHELDIDLSSNAIYLAEKEVLMGVEVSLKDSRKKTRHMIGL